MDELNKEIPMKSETLEQIARIARRESKNPESGIFMKIISSRFGEDQESLLKNAGFQIVRIDSVEKMKEEAGLFMDAQGIGQGHLKHRPKKVAV